MYTYKLGDISITDELYHDDLEAMTFGRKDQNELCHSGIKGMSWGKRRFQNEDGSLTAAGRNRYGVGDPLKGVSAYADTGGRGGSGVNYYRLPGGTGGSTRSVTANQAPARLPGSNPKGRATASTTTTQKVASTTNAGRKAADNIFGRIGNWASNAAKDVSNFATNTYNDASKAVSNAANAAGSLVGNTVKDVGNFLSNQDERQKMQDIIDKHYDPETNTFDSRENFEKFDNARTAYLNHPMTAVSEAGNWIGDRAKDVGNAASNIWDDVSATARGVADSVGNRLTGNIDRNTAESLRRTADFQEDPNAPYHSPMEQYTPENLRRQADEYQKRADNSLFSRIGNAAKDVGDWATNAYNDASKTVTNAAQDVGEAATNAYNDVSKAAGDAVNWVGDRAQDVGNLATNTANDVKSLFSDGSKEREALAEARSKINESADDPEFMSYFYEHDPEGAKRFADEQAEARKQLEQAEKNYMVFSNNPANTVSRTLNLPNNKGNWAFAVPGNEQYLHTMKTGFIPKTENVGDWFTGNNYKRTADTHNQYAKDYEDLADQAYAQGRESAETGRGLSQDWWNSEGDYIKNVYAKEDRDIADANMNMYNNAPRQKIVNAVNQVGETVSGAAKDVGNWAGNAAKDVVNWGGQQVENGKKLFKKIFG